MASSRVGNDVKVFAEVWCDLIESVRRAALPVHENETIAIPAPIEILQTKVTNARKADAGSHYTLLRGTKGRKVGMAADERGHQKQR